MQTQFEMGGLRFRLLERRDLSTTLRWRNDPLVRHQFMDSDEIAPEEHEAWFKRLQDSHDDHVFVFEDEDGLAGQVSIYDIDDRVGVFGRLIVPLPRLGRGYGTIATLAMICFATELGLKRLELEVKADNQRARRIYDNCGFTVTHHADTFLMSRTLPKAVQPWDRLGVAKGIDRYWNDVELDRRRELAKLIPSRSFLFSHHDHPRGMFDAGCGSGLLGRALGSPPWYRGVDSSCHMLALAKRASPKTRFMLRDLNDLQERARVVCCFEVLGHMANIDAAIASLVRATGKLLILSVWPEGASDASWDGVHKGWSPTYVTAQIRTCADAQRRRIGSLRWSRLGGTNVCTTELA